jgi:hypothetical protein
MKTLLAGVMSAALIVSLLTIVAEGTHTGTEAGRKKIFTKHFQATLFDITEHASYSTEILLDDKEYKIGKDVIGIVIHDKDDRDVAGADLAIILKNLETGDPASGTVTVTDKGNGLYIVSGLDLHREGRWELGITVKKDDVQDHVKFILPDAMNKIYPKGRYSP